MKSTYLKQGISENIQGVHLLIVRIPIAVHVPIPELRGIYPEDDDLKGVYVCGVLVCRYFGLLGEREGIKQRMEDSQGTVIERGSLVL